MTDTTDTTEQTQTQPLAGAAEPLGVKREDKPGGQVTLTIDIDAARVDAAYIEAVGHLGARVKLPGFRPGKAPRAVLEKRLGEPAIREHAIEDLVPVVVSEAIAQAGVEPIDRPRVDVVRFDRGQPARFTATVTVMPEVKLPDLGSLRVERTSTEVTDEMVDQRVAELLDSHATIVPVERPVQEGDIVVADLDVLTPEGAEVEGARRRAMEVEVREGVLIPELRAVLPGAEVDSTVEATVDMPEDAAEVELRGRPALLKMTVRGVKEKHVPRLDDSLAAKISNGEQQTALELKIAVRRDLEEQARQIERLAHEQKVLKALVDLVEVQVPPALVDHEVQHRLEDLEERLGRQGLKPEPYFSYLGTTRQQWLADARPEAEDRLKVDMVLDAATRELEIVPSDEEVVSHMLTEAARDPELAQQADQLIASRSARDYFRHRLTRIRTLERLTEIASGSNADGGQ